MAPFLPQISIHSPTAFLQQHWRQILPSWSVPVQALALYLQYSPVSLCDRTANTEQHKAILRQNFLTQAEQWSTALEGLGYWVDYFDPKFGTPVRSPAGLQLLDDVALAQQLLHFPVQAQGECKLLCHPAWGTHVFPSTLVTSASPPILTRLMACLRSPQLWINLSSSGFPQNPFPSDSPPSPS
ncbi:methylmalonic aciduria and homocystinuria type D protein [Lyngbya confervoides]|uniref:Methylmalonic aciduria and homocystinuria type D protein n=1 Tax=Lyngbya confervoides BDU141951 TaxID=1574623 RepID=A0ABD4TB59_9CYAN|nr:methylmalonic aciduria and homocystinuria type D protein [Lyngbya confervoides]MCM1985358.1 methylmalonic aciduria and homocystinuria type D protein [Lyngbya confervoides BDU141951]